MHPLSFCSRPKADCRGLPGIRKRGEALSECNCEQEVSLFPVVISWFGQLLIGSTQPSLGEGALWRCVLPSSGRLKSTAMD